MHGVQSARSSTLSNLRVKIAPAIFENRIPSASKVFATSYDRTTVPQIMELLGETHPDRDGKIQYPRLPPILYRGLDTTRVSGRFRNEDLFLVSF